LPARTPESDVPPPKDPAPDPTTRLLKQRIGRLHRELPQALAGEEEPVHQMRVAARRLRVGLPLLAQKPGAKRVRRALRRVRELTRAGGGSRDLDVVAALLEGRLAGAPSPQLKRLVRDLRAARARSKRRLAGDLLDLDIAGLRRDLRAILARRGVPIATALRRLRVAAAQEEAGALETLGAVGETFDPARLHRVRIRFRRLRYAAEVADALSGLDSGAPALFRGVQEAVGAMHDAFMLSGWLERKAARAQAAGHGTLAQGALAERDRALEQARAHHREFLALDPRALLARGAQAMATSLDAVYRQGRDGPGIESSVKSGGSPWGLAVREKRVKSTSLEPRASTRRR
jgi:CHAD domain-containing protein